MSEITSQTRRESWENVSTELSKRQREVITLLESYGESTAWELAEYSGRMIHALRPRLTELQARGVIEAVGKKMYPKTGKSEAIWRLKTTPILGVFYEPSGQAAFL